jgi:hypothetical protein
MLSSRSSRVDVDRIKRELVALIDENREVIYKIAFYSRPEVQSIMDRVLEAWEHNNRQGEPIDYATLEELEVLYRVAKEISKKKPSELWAEYWSASISK